MIAALQALEEVHPRVRSSGRTAIHWTDPIRLEQAMDALRQLRPWWHEIERRGLWANVEALGYLDPAGLGRKFGGYPDGAEPRKRWLSRLEGALLAGRRAPAMLFAEGRDPAVLVEIVARLPVRGLIREPTNWMREPTAVISYSVSPITSAKHPGAMAP